MMQERKLKKSTYIDPGIHSSIEYIRNLDKENDQNSIAIEYFGNKITRRDYWTTIDQYRSALINLGISKSDPVTVCMLNSPEYEFIFSALLENGSIASTVSKSFINADFKRQTIERGAKTLIISIEFVEELLKHRTFEQLEGNAGKSRLERIIFTSSSEYMPDNAKEQYSKSDFWALIDSANLPRNIEIIPPGKLAELASKNSGISLPSYNIIDEIATYSNTGGTTGAPKCAMHTHRAIISLLQSHNRELFKDFNMKKHARSLLVIPISHITSQFYALLVRRAYGANIIYNPFSFDPAVLRDILISERIDDVTLPFGLYYAITRLPFKEGELCIQTPCCGGEPTPYLPTKDVNSKLHKAGSSSLIIGTGSTEFGSGIMASYGIDGRSNESGYFFPYASGFILDPKTGEEITQEGKRGIFYANAPWQMKGYLNDQKATDEFFHIEKNGVLYGTNNDIAEIAGEHNGQPVYRMLGRASDFVLSDDHKIYYSGIKLINGRIIDSDFDNGEFLFDMRDLILNIDGVLEVQPIILPSDDGKSYGYAVANVTIGKDKAPIDILKDIYNHHDENTHPFMPMGIIFRTKFARSLSSDKREVLSLLDEREGYYRIQENGECVRISFPKGKAPMCSLVENVDIIPIFDPPSPKLVFSSL